MIPARPGLPGEAPAGWKIFGAARLAAWEGKQLANPQRESVWQYPRPPRLEASQGHIQIWFGGVLIAETSRSMRVLETGHPPVYYIPPEDVRMDCLTRTPTSTWCEWKGQAFYYTVEAGGKTAPDAAWAYLEPTPPFQEITGWLAFYPGKMDECTLNGERVRPQGGGFYGGWITSDLLGPFRGD